MIKIQVSATFADAVHQGSKEQQNSSYYTRLLSSQLPAYIQLSNYVILKAES